jgi:hypothetical protein
VNRFLAAAAVALVCTAPISGLCGTPTPQFQYIPRPCDIPGLSQEQYDTCFEHELCDLARSMHEQITHVKCE